MTFPISPRSAGFWRSLLACLLAVWSVASGQTAWIASQRRGDEALFLFGNKVQHINLTTQTWLSNITLPRSGATAMVADGDNAFVAYGTGIYRYGPSFTGESLVATASSSVHGLFLDGNLLIAVHSTGLYSRLTTYNRATGAQLSTKESYVDSLYGASHAPGANRVFGRTQGVSPSDIVYASYTDAGVLSSSIGSPYHGDYAEANKTWVFPDESRVVDSSGTAYSVTGLAYAGSFAGTITDIDFNGDVPIVLRGSEVIAFTPGLLETGRAAAGTGTGAEIYIAGTNALVFSPGTTTPGLSVVPLSAINAPEPGTPVDPNGLAFAVDEAFPDKDGNLLLWSKAQMSIFRWSPTERRYTGSFPLLGLPGKMAYSKPNHTVYLAYETGVVRKLDLSAAAPKEVPLFNLPSPANGLATAGEFIFASDYSGAWDTHYVYSSAGTLIHSLDWNRYSRVWEWDPVKRRMYFFRDDTSPNDLHWESLGLDGQITGSGETPYHGDFTVTPPIRAKADGSQVVIGSGVVFETTGMTKKSNLANGFTDAVWVGDKLVTIRLINGLTQLQTWEGAQLLPGAVVRQFNGTPLRILSSAAGLVIVTSHENTPRYILLNDALETLYISPTKPATPGNPLVSARDDHSITLQWQDLSDNEDGFRIEYRIGSGEWQSGATVAANAISGTVTGLAQGTVHEFRITATNAGLLSAPSSIVSGRTTNGPDEPVGEPYSLRITRIFNNRITLEWQDNASNETGFRVLRSTTAASVPTVLMAPANAVSFTDTSLAANTTYYYRVQAVNGSIEGDLSAQVNGKTLSSATVPSSPSSLVATAPTPTTVTLTWNDNSTNEDEFIVERSSNPAITWTELGRPGFNVKAFTDSSATADTAYSYRVRASNSSGVSSNTTTTIKTPKLGGDFAGYDIRSGNIHYFAFTGPHRIERYDLAARAWLTPVPLQAAATALWVDPAGIFVAEDRAVVRFALDGSARTAMANAESTVKGLFVLGDVLAFQNGESITTLDKTSGIILTTFTSYYDYKGSGFSVAPSMRRAFYRSTGVSPSDIHYVEIGTDGKLLKTAESPYHGDYPSATRTFVFPNGARVADNSGTVYTTDSLTYNNSLGGAFTDLAFYGSDVSIVLRNDKLVSYSNTLLEAGSFTLGSAGLRVGVEGTDALVFSVDGQSQRGLSVRIMPLSQLAAPVPGTAVDPRGLAYTPDDVFVDKDGNVLLFSKGQLSLFRWSPSQTKYLETLPLVGAPSFASYSAENHAAYFAYDSQMVRKMDLSAAAPGETPLLNLPSTPAGFTTAGSFLYVASGGNIMTFTPTGTQLTNSGFTYYYGNHNVWDPVNRRVYHFRDGTSPGDLHYDTLALDGRITGGGETPYHGDFSPTKPIRVKPDGSQIVIGSGVVFKASDMTKVASLANTFTDAAWHGGRLVTVRAINGLSQVQTWNEPQYTVGTDVRQVSGTPVRLIPLDAARLLLITLVDGVPRFTIFNTALESTYVSPSKPLAPSGLQVTARTTSSVSLAWTDGSDNEDGFRLEYRSGTGAWLDGGSVAANTPTGTVTGLNSGATYEFRALASNTGFLSTPSASVTATTLSHPDQPIGEPYGLRITRIFNDRITLEWQDNASNETGFNILRSTTPTGAVVSYSAAAGATSYTVTGLTAATIHYFRIQAVNGDLLGDLSAQVSGTTLSTNSGPTAPSTLAVASKTSNSVTLTWKDNSTNEDNFAVERSTSPATTWSTVATLPFNSITYTDTTVAANTAYSYRVRTANAVGSAVSSTVTVTTPKLGGDFAGHSIRAGDVYYFNFTGPNRIERYDIANRTWLSPVALEAAPTALWADEAGIYVAEDRAVFRFALDGSNRTPLGNSQTTVKVLFTLNDVLVFGPPGGELTSLNKKTGLFLSTFSTWYSGTGYATAPGLNRAFYRTSGVSPSDIGYLEVGPDGKLIKAQESPYHGDYPSGTRTFLFPDGARVADDSGTVYSSDSLAYTNSLGGAFTDLAFRGSNIPIVLRSNKLHSYSNTLLEAGSYTLPTAGLRVTVAGSDALVFIADGTQERGLKVQAVALDLLSAPQPGTAIDPRGLAFTPDDMFVDKDGNLLLFSKAHLSLFRWSMQQRRFLPSLPLIGSPKFAAYSKENHSAYFAYDTQVIRAMNLAAAAPQEQPLFNLPSSPRGLATAGEFIFSSDDSGAWDSHYIHSPTGTMIDSEEWNYYSRVWTWDPVKRRMYFFRDDTSPNDLHWESIAANGTISGEGETPYHGDFTVTPPIRVSPDGAKVVIGSGALFETTGMTRVTTLASTFVDAAWRGNAELLTIAASGTQTKLQRWTGANFSGGTSSLFTGAPHRIFRLDDGGFILITLDRGMPRFHLLDQNLAVIYQYAPDVPRMTGTPPLATEDTPFSWQPDLWQFAGSGQLTLQPLTLPAWLTLSNNILSGTPGESDAGDQVNRSKTHRIVLRVRDGLNNSEDREFFVTVNWQNDAPVLPATLPAVQANDAGDPTVTDFKPLLVDPDGLDTHHWEITGNTNPAIFSQTAIDDNGVLSLSYAPYVQGSSLLTLKATDASGASASATVQVTLPDLPPPLVTAGTELALSRLTGLYEQTVTVTNAAQRAIAGFQLSLSGLREGVTLYNGVNGAPGTASIAYQQPLAAGASVTMVLEYWASPRGEVPLPVISPAVTIPSPEAPAASAQAPQPFAINRCEKFSDGCVVVEFNAVPGKRYRVEYSSDAQIWKSCPVPMRASGTKLQWIDRGPPWTDCAPAAEPQRFYRVISLDN